MSRRHLIGPLLALAALTASPAPASFDGNASANFREPFTVHDGGGDTRASAARKSRSSMAVSAQGNTMASGLFMVFPGYLQRLPTSTPTATRTSTPTATRTATRTSTPTFSPTATRTSTRTSSPTPTATRTSSPTPSATRTSSPSSTFTATPTASPSPTATPTASPTPSATPTYVLGAGWSEDVLLSPSEGAAQAGLNDATPGPSTPSPAAGVPNLNVTGLPLYVSGTAWISSGGDRDVFQFRLSSGDVPPCQGYLKLTMDPPAGRSYSIELQAWDGTGWNYADSWSGDNGAETFLYYDMTAVVGNKDFYIVVRSNNGQSDSTNPYKIFMAMVPHATINGSLAMVCSEDSGAAGVEVNAMDLSFRSYGRGTTDLAGGYSLNVPAGLPMARLRARRSWYSSQPYPDWSQGPSYYEAPSPITLLSCQVLAAPSFKVYPEARVAGTVSGLLPATWVTFSLKDEYERQDSSSYNSGYYSAEFSPGDTKYVLHNVDPGVYRLQATASGEIKAPVFIHNVVATDGLTATANLSFLNGGTISGTISPAAAGAEVNAYEAGTNFGSWVGQTQGATTSYSIFNLPAGSYDIRVSDDGPGAHFSLLGVSVSEGGTTSGANISGLSPGAVSITGRVFDTLGLGMANLAVLGVRHGDSIYGIDGGGGPPIAFGSLAAVGPAEYSYALPVDTGYGSNWDVVLLSGLNNNGFPTFLDSLGASAPGLEQHLTTTSGVTVSGSFYVGSKTWFEAAPRTGNMNQPTAFLFKDPSLVWRDGNNSTGLGTYSTHAMPNGSYRLRAKPLFFNLADLGVNISGTPVGQNITLSPDPAQDRFLPGASQLDPAHLCDVTDSMQVFSLKLSDGGFGTGIDAGGGMITATVDGLPASNLSFNASTGLLTFQPGTPMAGFTLHPIVVNFRDQAGSVHVTSVNYQVRLVPATPTPTFTVSPTFTITPTFSASPSSTHTPSPTSTATPTPTPTDSPTATFTVTETATPTDSPTPTNSPTDSPTASPTATRTASPTRTHSPSSTASPSASPTATPTATRSASPTPTFSATPTATRTATPTATRTDSPTSSSTASPTDSPTATPSPTPTATPSRTPTATPSGTPSHSPSPSSTATGTATPTATLTPQAPGLTLVKSAVEGSAFVGSQVNYSIVVNNAGPGTAQGVQVYDSLPAGSIFAGPGALQGDDYLFNDAWRLTAGSALARGPFTLGVGQSVTLSLVVNLVSGTPGENLTNTAQAVDALFGQSWEDDAVIPILSGAATSTPSSTISPTFSVSPTFSATRTVSPSHTPTASPTSTPSDTATATETATPSSTATPSATPSRTPFPVLSLAKAANPSFVASAGDQITYVLTLSNNGSLAASSVSVWDSLPFNATFLSGPGSTYASGVVSWTLPSLAPAGSASFTFTASFTGSGLQVDNLASADASNQSRVDSNLSNVGVGAALTTTNTPTRTASPTATPTLSPSDTPTASPTATASSTPTASPSPTITVSPTASQTPAPLNVLVSLVRDQGQAWLGGSDFRFTVNITNTAAVNLTDTVITFLSDVGHDNQFLDVVEPNLLLGPLDAMSPVAWRLFTGGIDAGVDMGPLGIAAGGFLGSPRRIFAKVVGGQGTTLTSKVMVSSAYYGLAVSATVQTYIEFGPPATPTPAVVPSNTPTPIAAEGKIVAYPQPAKDNLCFDYHAPKAGSLKITVYNAAFHLVAEVKDEALGGLLESSCVDISGMAPGVYFYQAKVGDYAFPLGQFGIAR